MTLDEVSSRLRQAHGDIVSLDPTTFAGFKKRARFVDRDFGEWWALVYAVCRGTRHPERAKEGRRISIEEVNARLDARFGEGLIRVVPGTYRVLNATCSMIDAEFGEFTAYPQNVLNGMGHPKRWETSRSELTRIGDDEIRRRVLEVSDGRIDLLGPYEGMLSPCRFLDRDLGEFTALPANVIHKGTGHPGGAIKRREQSVEARFGVKYHMQHRGQLLKTMKARGRYENVVHWKTGEVLMCVGSYEVKTVQWLNSRGVDFLWQPQAFVLPDGKTYRPDFFLVTEETWVEVKGWFAPESKQKWEWFHAEHPNSELWDKQRLQDLGILPSRRVKSRS